MATASVEDMGALLDGTRSAFSPDAAFHLPSEKAFENATARFTIYKQPNYSASISVRAEGDIQAAIKVATTNNIPFLATSGGHGYNTSSGALQGGLQINLSGMKQIDIDTETNTVTIEPGVTFADLIDPLYERGKEISTGSCSSTSVIGVTIGGGVGRWQTFHGLLVDQLLSARVAVASGDVVIASATENPDLCWGIRGGGAHLGIVTQATYRIADLTNEGDIQVADLVLPIDAAEPLLKSLEALEATKPQHLIVTAYAFFNPIINAPVLMVNFMYPGPKATLLTQIQPLLALQPLTSDIKPIQWNHLIRDSVFGLDAIQATRGHATNAGGLNLRNVEIEPLLTITRNLAKLFEEHPAARAGSLWLLEWWDSTVVKKVGVAETAYAWRDSVAYMVIAASWPPELPASDPAAVAARAWAAEAREICGAISGYRERKVFATYADGSERAEQVFGRNLERLREVKRRWDPGNSFRFAGALGQ